MRHRGAVTTATSRGPPNLNAPGSCERALKKSSRGWRRGLIVFVAFSRLRFAKPQLEVDGPHQIDLVQSVGGPGLWPGPLLAWQQRGEADPWCGQPVALQ